PSVTTTPTTSPIRACWWAASHACCAAPPLESLDQPLTKPDQRRCLARPKKGGCPGKGTQTRAPSGGRKRNAPLLAVFGVGLHDGASDDARRATSPRREQVSPSARAPSRPPSHGSRRRRGRSRRLSPLRNRRGAHKHSDRPAG